MAKAEYTCIVCPLSCRITVEENSGELRISGNTCKRGEEHARNEHTAPRRMLTTTVAIRRGVLSRLPVISSGEIPKLMLKDCLDLLYSIRLEAPVHCNDVVVENILGTGIDIIASRSLLRTENDVK